MVKEVVAIGGGVIVGVALCYGGYRLYKYYTNKNDSKERDVFAERLKEKEEQEKKLDELINNQTYVESLKATDLTSWFKENRSVVPQNAKMIIVVPTPEHMKGLGYTEENDLDLDSNLLQVFYDDEKGEVYKIRLVNYTNIDSNFQAMLIEQDGMIVVTE